VVADERAFARILTEAGFAGRIGAARRDITPPDGIRARSWGPATTDFATGVHRPLTLTAIAFLAQAAQPLVLISADLGWWGGVEDERFVRGAVLEVVGGDEARAIVHLTHTHAGPSISLADGDPMSAAYLYCLRAAAGQAATEAVATAVPATLTCTTTHCSLAANRDLADGKRYIVGFNPHSAADDTLLVGRIAGEAGETIATLVNYACHPTTLAWQNSLISPDYVGAAREVIEAASGGAPCAFLQGASGELAPRQQYVGDVRIADRHGHVVGHAAAAALAGMTPPGFMLAYEGVVESGAPLAMWQPRPHRPRDDSSATFLEVELDLKELPAVEELERRWRGIDSNSLEERLRRARNVRELFGDERTYRYPVWLWRLGDCLIVGQPGEAYSRLQQELRRRHPSRAIVVMNLANGPGAAYLPDEALYDCDVYPVWQTVYARGSLERLIEAVDDAIISDEKAASTKPGTVAIGRGNRLW
jgi:hypothetical protein